MMQNKYFIDESGKYIGAFCGAEPPAGAIEVDHAPHDARQLWLFPGWSPLPVTVPQEVTRFQARAALYQAGLLGDVETVMSEPYTDMMLKLAWQDAQTFKRTSSFVLGIAKQLGLTEQQLDDLFITAGGIE